MSASLSYENVLIVQASEGNERAFSILFDLHHKRLATLAFRMTRSQELTEEIVQDVFVKVWLKRDMLKTIDHLDRFLYTMCRNQTLNTLKKVATERASAANAEKELILESESELLENPAEFYRALIEESVSKLPAQQRKVYTMSRHERLKYHEIAEKLELSELTVKKHIQLAIKYIQSDLRSRLSLRF